MRRLLLVSTSTVHGTGYLDHCEAEIRDLFAGCERLLFVPFALHDRDAYAAKARERFARMGLALESVHEAADPPAAVEETDGVFVGGGNTFRLLATLYQQNLLEPLRRRCRAGLPYLGTSAGANLACPTIKTTNDMPIVEPPSFTALGLVPFQINPHYIDADSSSTHMGETRDQRLAEFLEEKATPVVALREGAMLRVRGEAIELDGAPGGRLFRRDRDPVELLPGSRLDPLLAGDRSMAGA